MSSINGINDVSNSKMLVTSSLSMSARSRSHRRSVTAASCSAYLPTNEACSFHISPFGSTPYIDAAAFSIFSFFHSPRYSPARLFRLYQRRFSFSSGAATIVSMILPCTSMPAQRSQPRSYMALCMIFSMCGVASCFFNQLTTVFSGMLPPPWCRIGKYPTKSPAATAKPMT